MSLRYRIDHGKRQLRAWASDHIGPSCIDSWLDAVVQDGNAAGLDTLVDLRKVQTLELGRPEVRALAQRCSSCPSSRRVAIVAERDDVFGMARMFGLFSEDALPKLRIFRTLQPALDHLG